MTAICAVTNSKKFHIAIKDISYTVFEMEKEVKSSEVIIQTLVDNNGI
jgi:hypothetical protein